MTTLGSGPERIVCPGCQAALSLESLIATQFSPCPGCGSRLQVELFPALITGLQHGATGDTLLTDGEAGCFHHPEKKAVVSCDECGRFLCALCDIDFHGRHLCPQCINSGMRKGALANVGTRHVLFDNLALALALLPLLIWPVTIITAPAAIFVAIRYWKQPLSVLPRSRFRFVLAILISTAILAGWATLIIWLLNR